MIIDESEHLHVGENQNSAGNELHEECGIFGIFTNTPTDVAAASYYALYALHHRGQESCGIVVNKDGVFTQRKGLGLADKVFTKEVLESFPVGNAAVAHSRYSTGGSSAVENAQPLFVRHGKGNLAIAHNGNIINSKKLTDYFEKNGAIFHSTSDCEIIGYLITEGRTKEKNSIEEAVSYAMERLEGAYSLVIMSPSKLILARDPNGFRPLCIGKLSAHPGENVLDKDADCIGYAAASETCALDIAGAVYERDILPGEIVVISKEGITSIKTHCGKAVRALCVFEFVYFARPDSVIDGMSVHEARVKAGRFLYQQEKNPIESKDSRYAAGIPDDGIEADIVVGVPDSGIDAAIGYSRESGIPYAPGLVKNRYIGRTFIQPAQIMRENSVKIKLNPISSEIKGKRVVLVDDSIVRGTTTKNLIKLLRDSGAAEVHMRASSPPFLYPCYFGTDIDSREKLIAANNTVEQIREKIGADSLVFVSVENISQIAAGESSEGEMRGFCTGCFTGEYPVEVPKEQPGELAKNKFDQEIRG